MDITSLLGAVSFAAIVFFGVITGEIPKIIFNLHAFLIVIGGTFVASLISSSPKRFIAAFYAFKRIFLSNYEQENEKIISHICDLAKETKKSGFKALKNADPNLCDGFVKRVCEAAFEYGDKNFVKQVIEQEINNSFEDLNEAGNVYRNMAVLSPMFGLIGTLLGIIAVLKELSNPQAVGPAMAVAITSAFYGILLSNILFTPVANKLRDKSITYLKVRGMILEGVLDIMNGSSPILIERRMRAFTGKNI